jgi:nucleoside-diphosphate-sugar epimerase
MSQEIKNVVLAGAGGNLGPTILDALLNAGKFNVTVLSRPDSKSEFPANVNVIKTDYSESSLAEALQGQDAVVSTIAGAAIPQQTQLIDAAVKAGVKRFLPSEFGSNTTNENSLNICPLFRQKVQIIEYLESKAKRNPNFSWTSLMTGPFFDWCLRVGFTGFDLKTHTATVWDNGTNVWSATNLATVGKAVVSVLLRPEETKNRHSFIQSFNVSQNDVLAALEKATGTKWQVNHVDSDERTKTGNELIKQGDFTGFPLLILAVILNGKVDVGSDFTKVAKLDNDLLGLPKEDLQATIDAIVKGN